MVLGIVGAEMGWCCGWEWQREVKTKQVVECATFYEVGEIRLVSFDDAQHPEVRVLVKEWRQAIGQTGDSFVPLTPHSGKVPRRLAATGGLRTENDSILDCSAGRPNFLRRFPAMLRESVIIQSTLRFMYPIPSTRIFAITIFVGFIAAVDFLKASIQGVLEADAIGHDSTHGADIIIVKSGGECDALTRGISHDFQCFVPKMYSVTPLPGDVGFSLFGGHGV